MSCSHQETFFVFVLDCCHVNLREHKLHRCTDYKIIPFGEKQSKKIRGGCKTQVLIKAEAYYLEHVCIAVVCVLHHHHLDSRQSVRDAVLVFVAYGLKGQKEEGTDEYREAKRGRTRQRKTSIDAFKSNPSLKI